MMPDKCLKYDLMVAEFEGVMTQNRAQRVGIVTAKNVPKLNILL